ncbi:hypothetical protein BJ741DRAFT_622685 [Chytriomyces cf. hyalinus JEL632]|nr:hypothetical protein BJ741DRAFT_622685 [Chytriomyces cf. hyalinus JEL632]
MSCFQLSASSICGQEFANVWLSPTQGFSNEFEFNSHLQSMMSTAALQSFFKCRQDPPDFGAIQYQISFLCSSAAYTATSICPQPQPPQTSLCPLQCQLASESAQAVLLKEGCDASIVSDASIRMMSDCSKFSKSPCWPGTPTEIISCGYLDGRLCQPSDSHLAPPIPVAPQSPLPPNQGTGSNVPSAPRIDPPTDNGANRVVSSTPVDGNPDSQQPLQSESRSDGSPQQDLNQQAPQDVRAAETNEQTQPQSSQSRVAVAPSSVAVDPATEASNVENSVSTSSPAQINSLQQPESVMPDTVKNTSSTTSQSPAESKLSLTVSTIVLISAIVGVVLFFAVAVACYLRHRRRANQRIDKFNHRLQEKPSPSPTHTNMLQRDGPTILGFQSMNAAPTDSSYPSVQQRGSNSLSSRRSNNNNYSVFKNHSTISMYTDPKEHTTSTVEIRGKEFMHVKFSADTKQRDAPPKFDRRISFFGKKTEGAAEIPKRSASRNKKVAVETACEREDGPDSPVSPTDLPPALLVKSILKQANAQRNTTLDR